MASPSPVPLPSALVVKNGSSSHAQRERATLWHGVAGVRQRVQEHLPELLAVGMQERHLRGELPHYYNTMVAQMVVNECQRVVYFLTHVQRGNLRLATATELEQVGHKLAHPLDLL